MYSSCRSRRGCARGIFSGIALRAILCSSEDEWVLFEDLFTAFWSESDSRPGSSFQKSDPQTIGFYRAGTRESIRNGCRLWQWFGAGRGGRTESLFRSKRLSSDSKRSISRRMPRTDLEELERIALRLLRRMSHRVARKLRARKCREIVDLRRTIRQSIGRGGDLIDLRYKGPKRERAKLVILLDVSDSMNPYSFFLLKFAYVLGKHSKEVKSFIFSTILVEITDLLRTRRMSDALRMLSQMTMGWSGGTRIGGSLQDFNRRHAPALLSRNTVFIILSDGWDTGPPEELAAEMRKIKHRVVKLIWLNPLLGLEDYKPVTRGISAALPFIDVFAPAHNLQSLLALEKHLSPRK